MRQIKGHKKGDTAKLHINVEMINCSLSMLTEKCLAIAGIEGTNISDDIDGTLAIMQMTIKINNR